MDTARVASRERAVPLQSAEFDITRPPESLWRDAWRRLLRNKAAVAGGIFVLIIVVVAIVFGIGRLGSIGEAIGRLRDRMGPAGHDAVTSPKVQSPGGAPTADEIRGPVEDAELVDDGEGQS